MQVSKALRLQLAEENIGNGHPVTKVLRYLGIASSGFYYKPKPTNKERGKKQSKVTRIAGKGYVSVMCRLISMNGRKPFANGTDDLSHRLTS